LRIPRLRTGAAEAARHYDGSGRSFDKALWNRWVRPGARRAQEGAMGGVYFFRFAVSIATMLIILFFASG
jgi:hypothetical protein